MIFNENWKIIKKLASGYTSDVFLAENLNDSQIKISIKILSSKYLNENKDAISHMK